MKLSEAVEKAFQILNEEQHQPTVGYRLASKDPGIMLRDLTEGLSGLIGGSLSTPQVNLFEQRKHRPRTVNPSPDSYVFVSSNYELLIAILQQVAENNRGEFIFSLLKILPQSDTWLNGSGPVAIFPVVNGYVSCLPLLAEFCIRTGNTAAFYEALQEPKLPTFGLAIMLKQLEETIALNFNVFSVSDMEQIPKMLDHLREMACEQRWTPKRERGSTKGVIHNARYKPGFGVEAKEIVDAIDGIREECRKALFFYLRDELQQTRNFEIESDERKVKSFLTKLGFSNEMIGTLNAAEAGYRSSSPFELKSCLSHIRSFLEHLHREAARSIAGRSGGTVKDRWGDATEYLRKNEYFSRQHGDLVTSLYTLISDESVHPLGADREYARLLRNVVIEYGVMFLSALDKKGVNLRGD